MNGRAQRLGGALLAVTLLAACGDTAPRPRPTASGSTFPTAGPVTPSGTATPSSRPSTPPPPGSVGKPVTPMPEARFWSLLDGTWVEDDDEIPADNVEDAIKNLSDDDLAAFKARAVVLGNGICTWRSLGAAQVIMGGIDRATFANFRTWLVHQGKLVYTNFRANPDSLAGFGPTKDAQIAGALDLGLVPDRLYVLTAATPLSSRRLPRPCAAPAGQKINDSYAALATRFPKLADLYLAGGIPPGRPDDAGPRVISLR